MNSIWSIKNATSAPKTRLATSGALRRVFVGLSGGVDSAVSAALLQKEGFEVTGVFIRISLPGYPCTAGEDRVEAMRVAAHLRIPFKEIDLSEEYKKRVFDLSMCEFACGRTPNPDVLCNREIKFGIFYDWAMAQGAEYVATGHYARTTNEQGSTLLKVGADADKDQSYFLALVPEEKLRHTLFPIGHLHKQQVRALAKKFGLPNAERKDSQGLCFLGSISMEDILERELGFLPGALLSESGEVVGTHRGAALYTLGQRHGFSAQDASRYYVTDKDTEVNTVTVSREPFPRRARTTTVLLAECNWIGLQKSGGEVGARYRYRQALIPAHIRRNEVTLLHPHYVPTGQLLALYAGERCLGGGVVARAEPHPRVDNSSLAH